MVRMTSSGTEATMSVIRLARAVTGREKILKFAGAYHGHVDGLLAQAGSGLATQGIPASPGVTESAAATTVIVPWNDAQALRRACTDHRFAALLAEPVPANMGVVAPEPGFLELLRELADANGALLVFDEVITGFRVARGGAQEHFGVMPDLTIMGKIVGGGLPAAAYGGARELMERIAPAGDVYQAGTLSGNPVAVAAGMATLKLIQQPGFYENLGRQTAKLVQGLAGAAREAGVTFCANSVGGMFGVYFAKDIPQSYATMMECDKTKFNAFFHAMLDEGVYLAPSAFEAGFVSAQHDDAVIEVTVAAAKKAFARVA
jgi:glutamate-1-semialdehyde 2,1-aminomutase